MSTEEGTRRARRQQALALLIPESIPDLAVGDNVLFSPGMEGLSVGGTVIAGQDADGYVRVRYAGTEPFCVDQALNAWLQPGDACSVAWGDRLTGLVLGAPCGPHGNNIPDGRIVRPIPLVPAVHEVMEIRPGQPIPGSPRAFVRRNRAGNTLRVKTSRGTWAPINVASDGTRFKRHQLTTKICQGARERLDLLAADAQLRVCEVLEALILAPDAEHTVATAKPVGIKVVTPAKTLPDAEPRAAAGQRTRLTRAQAEQLDAILSELIGKKRTSSDDLLQAAAMAAAHGLPQQGVSTLRTRLRRLQLRLQEH